MTEPAIQAHPGARSAVPGSDSRLGAWILLFGSLCLNAGHGLFLVAALSFTRERPGPRLGLLVAWFVAAIPLALVAMAARRALMRWGLLGLLSKLTALVTLAAFALYSWRMFAR